MSGMKKRKYLPAAGSCSLLFALTYVFFAPMEVILLNSGEFNYTFESFWWFQLLLTFAAAGLMTLVMTLLPGKGRLVTAALALGAAAAAWAQMLFMNGHMIRLTGEKMEVSGQDKALNLVIWLLIVAVAVALALLTERKWKKAGTWMCAAAAFLTAVQLVAFVSLLFTTDFSENRDGHSYTRSGEYELSSGTNVVEFLFDASDGEFVHQMLDAYPELNEQLSGWVYYPNATSGYSRTFPSLTYMLSGGKCHLDIPVKEYVDGAFEKSDFFSNLYEAGTDIRVFTMDTGYISTSTDYMIKNSRKRDNRFSDLNLAGLEKGLGRISLFKCVPYACKQWFSYDVGVLNILAFNYRHYNWYDPDFYAKLEEQEQFTVSSSYDKAYRFYHLWGSHGGGWWDDRLEKVENETEPYIRLRGSFRILEEYCRRMKDAGVYDDSLIIVVADHGQSNDDWVNLVRNRASCPLLMVKYPHSDAGQKLKVSRAPVCHEDLFSTVADALGAKRPTVGSGKTTAEFAEGDVRERYHYYTALNKRRKPEILREYVIRGDAEDFSSWEATGNVWDVLIEW